MFNQINSDKIMAISEYIKSKKYYQVKKNNREIRQIENATS